MQDLKEKTVRGAFWDINSNVICQFIQLAVTPIMARLLTPSDFGLWSMAMVFVVFLNIFAQLGMGTAIVQKKDLTDEHIASVFVVNIMVGFVLCAAYILLAPLISGFFRQKELERIIYFVSINFVVNSFATVQASMLTRALKFKKVSLINIFSAAVSAAVGVALAALGFGVWSLVWSAVLATFLTTLLLWVKPEWAPKIYFKFSKVKDVIGFSGFVLFTNTVSYFSRNIQDILIGRMLDLASLGYYSMANRVMLFPLQTIAWRVGNVMLPSYSRIQHDLAYVRSAYAKTLRFLTVFTFPIMAGFVCSAPEIVNVIVGPQWGRAIPLIQVLSLAGLIQIPATTAGALMLSQGRSALLFKWTLFATLVTCVTIYAGLRFGGLMGAAAFYAAWSWLSMPILIRITTGTIKMPQADFVKAILPALFASLAMACFVWAVRWALYEYFKAGIWLVFVYEIFSGAVFYYLVIKVALRGTFEEIKATFSEVFPGIGPLLRRI